MTFIQARNRIISELTKYIGRPVRLSGQIDDIPEYPYCYYSVLTTRVSDHAFGLEEVERIDSEFIRRRSESVTATMSFTFCSENRETETGYVLGEDEALELAEKAHGFFLLNAHNISTNEGDIVIRDVGRVANRAGFHVEDTVRRYGFDIRFAYVRTDEMNAATIKSGNFKGKIRT